MSWFNIFKIFSCQKEPTPVVETIEEPVEEKDDIKTEIDLIINHIIPEGESAVNSSEQLITDIETLVKDFDDHNILSSITDISTVVHDIKEIMPIINNIKHEVEDLPELKKEILHLEDEIKQHFHRLHNKNEGVISLV